MKGKWSSELKKLASIEKRLNQFEQDVEKIDLKLATETLEKFFLDIESVSKIVRNTNSYNFFDENRIPLILDHISSLQNKLDSLLEKIELKKLDNLEKDLDQFVNDVARVQGQAPSTTLEKFNQVMKSCSIQVSSADSQYALDTNRFPRIQSKISSLNARLKDLHEYVKDAETKADKLCSKFKDLQEDVKDAETEADKPFSIFKKKLQSTLIQFYPQHQITIRLFKLRQSDFELFNKSEVKFYPYQGIREPNALKKVLLTTDSEFIDDVSANLVTENEIGLLAAARVNFIYNSLVYRQKILQDKSSKTQEEGNELEKVNALLKQTNIAIRNLMNLNICGLKKAVDFDEEQLKIAVTQLILHKRLHPTEDFIWIGSARAVHAYVVKSANGGTYLNVRDDKWSWGLNRVWMNIALSLGYKIRLAEQHFPAIEEALLKGDRVKFLFELIRESRLIDDDQLKEGRLNWLKKVIMEAQNKKASEMDPSMFSLLQDFNNTYLHLESMYNGGDSPTASCMEILALLDMNCVAYKNEEGYLCLYQPPKVTKEEELISRAKEASGASLSAHTIYSQVKASPMPPLNRPSEHLKTPEQSQSYRT